ncbi:MAG: hypothetical protein JJT96_09145 [Opitutales bacterium]|nr:hypothetical protein [Opitutales bacterium]
MTLSHKALIAVCCLVGGIGLSAARLELFLEPDATRERIAVIEEGDQRLRHGSALFQQELARERWAWAEFESEFRGFIREQDIGKDQEPLAGAEVFTRPTEASSILTRFGPDDEFRVVREGRWWEILITKSIPVYYQLPPPAGSPPPPAPARTPAAQVAETRPAPEPVRAQPSPTPEPRQTFVEDARPRREPPPAQIQVREPVETRMDSSRPAPSTGQARSDQTVGTSGDLPRTFTGTLRQAPRSNPFRSPVRPLELVNADGRHLAWVDTSRMVSPTPVSQMVGRRITIFGDFERANNRPEIILFAKSIHPR